MQWSSYTAERDRLIIAEGNPREDDRLKKKKKEVSKLITGTKPETLYAWRRPESGKQRGEKSKKIFIILSPENSVK